MAERTPQLRVKIIAMNFHPHLNPSSPLLNLRRGWGELLRERLINLPDYYSTTLGKE